MDEFVWSVFCFCLGFALSRLFVLVSSQSRIGPSPRSSRGSRWVPSEPFLVPPPRRRLTRGGEGRIAEEEDD